MSNTEPTEATQVNGAAHIDGSAGVPRDRRPAATPQRMRFHVDGWDPSYGSSVEDQDALTESTARVTADVEVPTEKWAPIPPEAVTDPGAVLFVDGVRRIEARLWIDQPATDGPVGNPATDATMALCASYGAGVVCCCPDGGAHLLYSQTRRGLFTTATNATDLATSAGVYRVNLSANDPTASLPVLLSASLQRQLTELELIVAAQARAELGSHGVAAGSDLLVIDGPLRGRQHLPRAVGFIKSHRTSYLDPTLHSMVAQLRARERTPVFLMGTTWDRHSWYLRLPCQPGAPWTGVVRIECAADVTTAQAVELANLTQALLPRYASVEYKDSRAPQNLVPVAGLERQLRRHLGDVGLLSRALRAAAARS